MSFTDYIFAIIGNTKTSLEAGIHAFFDAQNKSHIEYSKQAFSKGRQRIKPEAFQELFLATVDKFYETADFGDWHGYHPMGIDGTRLNLPCTKELREIYGEQTSQGAPQVQALVSCLYDLVNGMIVDARIDGCKSSERDAAQDLIETFHIEQITNPVFIMDRGYPSGALIDAVIRSGHKFVMRCPVEFLSGMHLPEQDKTLEHKFARLKHPVKLRIVKVPLSEGDIEYLATNIFETDISAKDLYDLYHLRWGIETKYNDVKNKLEIENFTGYSPDAILQDFYASLFLANLAGALEFDLHEKIEAAHNKPENKYEYRMNMNMIISELKGNVVKMLVAESKIKRAKLFYQIQRRLKNAVVPVRPNRNFPRTRRHLTAKFSQNMKKP